MYRKSDAWCRLFLLPRRWRMFDYSRKNKRWRNLRKLALRRDRGFCREAARYGRLRPRPRWCITSGRRRIIPSMPTACGTWSASARQPMTPCTTGIRESLRRWGFLGKIAPPPPLPPNFRDAYSWAGNSFHTQRRKFQKKPAAKKIPGAYVGGTRLHCTAMGRGDIVRR